MIQDAQEVFVEAQERGMVTTYLTNALLNAYARQGMWHECKRLYACIKEDQYLRVDTYTFVSMFTSSARTSVPYTFFNFLFDDMQQLKIRLNTHLACSIVSAYRVASDLPVDVKLNKARRLLQQMRQEGVPRNTEFFNSLICLTYDCELYKETMDVFREMEQEGLEPDDVTFRCLVLCCREFGYEEKAKEFLKLMHTLKVLKGE
eukprot:TRINITY_DN3073_c1_g1_i6.p1 TRINITY_DN3073_c1_g1~~TRINITY_DN3073_c1_g1_i6.p1  ORF type:complete len:226 (-),score=14.16 TRINITY_DN3073_c1_g1_i6:561-1172(-)